MKKSALLFAASSALVFGLPMISAAYDDDPGYGPFRPWYGNNGDRTYPEYGYGGDRDRHFEPLYFRPTMRYFAKGYTVSYRYVPVYFYDVGYGQQNSSANFRTEAFRIATADIPAWGAKPPRLVVRNGRTPSQSAITSIQPVKQTPVYKAPASLELPSTPVPTPNLDPTPGAAPAPAPAPDAPKP